MARIISTSSLNPKSFDGQDLLSIYNGLDCCVTVEVWENLKPQLSGPSFDVYEFEKTLQAPAMEMMLRGIRVDEKVRYEQIHEYRFRLETLQRVLDKLTRGIFGIVLNPNSPAQMGKFFYKTLDLPEVWSRGKITTDRKALEKLSAYMYARPFINCILAIRDCTKTLGVLTGGVDADDRIRASYNVAGTETGRMSSSENAFGTGTNLQNITEKLRPMFVSDPRLKLGYFDLEQAESRAVGIIIWRLFNDPVYLDYCESGDLHTNICRDIWPDLGWTTDAKANREIADRKFYRDFSYRDLSKRGGHGTNYYGQPQTMAKFLNVAPKLIVDFQAGYFKKFPGIRKWHTWVAKELQTKGIITTFMGRERHFFGRLSEDETLRSSIAFEPQSVVADIMDKGILQVWRKLGNVIQTHAQVHDAGIFQYPAELEDTIVPEIMKTIVVPLEVAGRHFTIPVEAKVGWNWGVETKDNPNGLRKFKGHDARQYQATPDILHRELR